MGFAISWLAVRNSKEDSLLEVKVRQSRNAYQRGRTPIAHCGSASPRPTGFTGATWNKGTAARFFRLRHRSGEGLRDWIEIEDLNTIFR